MEWRVQPYQSSRFEWPAVLACLAVFVLAVCFLTSCATVRTVADVGTDLCRVWMAQHPERATQPDGVTCDAIAVADPFIDAVNLAVAKPQPDAIKEALAAHPPLSAAANAALALPCIDTKNPYEPAPEPADGPQSRLERRLYPPLVIVDPEHAGE
jgi:hypothetical protein